MTAFAVAGPADDRADLMERLKESFLAEANRWQVTHTKGWHDEAEAIWARIASIYTTTLATIAATDGDVSEELRSFSAFLATPLSDALDATGGPSDFSGRLATLSSDMMRVAGVSRATAALVEQTRSTQLTQAISTLPQIDTFADFQQLYVNRNFVDIDTEQLIASDQAMLAGFPFRAVLLGPPGAGKSTFVQHLIRAACDEVYFDVHQPALEIRCREYARTESTWIHRVNWRDRFGLAC